MGPQRDMQSDNARMDIKWRISVVCQGVVISYLSETETGRGGGLQLCKLKFFFLKQSLSLKRFCVQQN